MLEYPFVLPQATYIAGAGIGAALFGVEALYLKETLPPAARKPFAGAVNPFAFTRLCVLYSLPIPQGLPLAPFWYHKGSPPPPKAAAPQRGAVRWHRLCRRAPVEQYSLNPKASTLKPQPINTEPLKPVKLFSRARCVRVAPFPVHAMGLS